MCVIIDYSKIESKKYQNGGFQKSEEVEMYQNGAFQKSVFLNFWKLFWAVNRIRNKMMLINCNKHPRHDVYGRQKKNKIVACYKKWI